MPSQSVQKLFNLEEKNKGIYFIISVVAHSDSITISRLDGHSKFQIFPAAIFNGLEDSILVGSILCTEQFDK